MKELPIALPIHATNVTHTECIVRVSFKDTLYINLGCALNLRASLRAMVNGQDWSKNVQRLTLNVDTLLNLVENSTPQQVKGMFTDLKHIGTYTFCSSWYSSRLFVREIPLGYIFCSLYAEFCLQFLYYITASCYHTNQRFSLTSDRLRLRP